MMHETPLLTERQWQYIVYNSIGLHGDNNATTVTGTGASFCMSVGVRERCVESMTPPTLDMLPSDWYSQLRNTIEWIKRFSTTTHLMITRGSECDEAGYIAGCFPKCCGGAHPICSIALAGKSTEALIEWVIDNIPEEPESDNLSEI